tara:strand:+ start:1917 stop:3089 length:1173 start_codon:yes stop_codon:yes gene_type:complete
MEKHIVELTTPLKGEYHEELYRRVFFVSSDILEFELLYNNGKISAIEISYKNKLDIEQTAKKINELVENEIAVQKILEPNKIWENKEARKYHEDVFTILKSKGAITVGGEGQVGFGEPLIKLMDYFDARIMEIVNDLFKAEEFRYPTLIPTKVVEKCGCVDSFPQLLMFVSSLHNDLDYYKKFKDEFKKEQEINSYVFDYVENVDYCLPPTMCYHTYNQFKDSVFSNEFKKVVTSKGKSFRNESRYQKTLERLWDFTIREIVFLGNQEFVAECRKKMMEASFSLMEELGLNGHAEVANDPFFASPDTAFKTFNQRLQALKYELRMNLQENHTISIASFNYHEHFFGENFNMKFDSDSHIITGCVGFGLERFMFAFLTQYGLDESNWPIKL